jgi:hypothetical protein
MSREVSPDVSRGIAQCLARYRRTPRETTRKPRETCLDTSRDDMEASRDMPRYLARRHGSLARHASIPRETCLHTSRDMPPYLARRHGSLVRHASMPRETTTHVAATTLHRSQTSLHPSATSFDTVEEVLGPLDHEKRRRPCLPRRFTRPRRSHGRCLCSQPSGSMKPLPKAARGLEARFSGLMASSDRGDDRPHHEPPTAGSVQAWVDGTLASRRLSRWRPAATAGSKVVRTSRSTARARTLPCASNIVAGNIVAGVRPSYCASSKNEGLTPVPRLKNEGLTPVRTARKVVRTSRSTARARSLPCASNMAGPHRRGFCGAARRRPLSRRDASVPLRTKAAPTVSRIAPGWQQIKVLR